MQDDWREETQLRLKNSKIYQILKIKCDKDAVGNHILALIDEATNYAYQRTKTILIHMREFTLHDGDHLFRVLKLMEKLLPETTVEKLTLPELMLLILCAFFHDIGMAPSENEIISWKKIWDESPLFVSDEEESENRKFKRYCSSRLEQMNQIQSFEKNRNNTAVDIIKGYLITDYIRSTHASRAKDIIQNDWEGKIKYRDTDLTVEFAEICFSHNEDALLLLNMDKNYLRGRMYKPVCHWLQSY